MNRLMRNITLANLLLMLILALSSFTVSAKERITYFHNDVLGSPVAATDAQGALLWQEEYSAFGKRLLKQDTGRNARWFTGKSEVAALGVQYFDARWYEPELGRFLSIDPADFNERDIHSFNRYAYVNNNPYRYVDPNGESPLDVGFLVVDVVKLGVAVYNGEGVGAAVADVAMSAVGVISPVPGVGLALKSAKAVKTVKSVDQATEVATKVTKEAPKYARNKYKALSRTEKKRVLGENPTCVYCEKKPSTTVDHVRSQKQDWDQGGWVDSRDVRSARVNDPSNLTGACSSCNPSKGSKPLGTGEGQWTPPKDR